MNISGWLPFYISELYINFECVTSRRVDRFDSVLPRPDHFQQVLISSPACALIRFYDTILISMPIGHWVRTIFGIVQVLSFGFCFHSPTHCSGFFHACKPCFPAASIRLHRQQCFTDEIHEDSFLKGTVPYYLRSRSRFSGGSFFRCGTRSFL